MPKRGPRTQWDDDALLEKIRQVRDDSPFHTEGYRKVWARLRRLGVFASRKRVQRIMREANLLQPPFEKTGKIKLALERRFGCITTNAPNIMWGFDSTKLLTSTGDVVTLFIVIEHWNSEVLAWQLTTDEGVGPAKVVIEQALSSSAGPIPFSGLSLRLDHWELLTSPAFTAWLSALGIEPFFIFPMQPEGNGIAERFFRTLKDEVSLLPSSFDNVFQEMNRWLIEYNRSWLLERLKYRSPWETRLAYKSKVA